ncbi:hypothetical protein EVA_06959 [gut metagenome]|uniref:Uncharacterized protein n=1 Tax=gut metagenome TaxID=749906 RepID=J9GC69_9ZZZZ
MEEVLLRKAHLIRSFRISRDNHHVPGTIRTSNTVI